MKRIAWVILFCAIHLSSLAADSAKNSQTSFLVLQKLQTDEMELNKIRLLIGLPVDGVALEQHKPSEKEKNKAMLPCVLALKTSITTTTILSCLLALI